MHISNNTLCLVSLCIIVACQGGCQASPKYILYGPDKTYAYIHYWHKDGMPIVACKKENGKDIASEMACIQSHPTFTAIKICGGDIRGGQNLNHLTIPGEQDFLKLWRAKNSKLDQCMLNAGFYYRIPKDDERPPCQRDASVACQDLRQRCKAGIADLTSCNKIEINPNSQAIEMAREDAERAKLLVPNK